MDPSLVHTIKFSPDRQRERVISSISLIAARSYWHTRTHTRKYILVLHLNSGQHSRISVWQKFGHGKTFQCFLGGKLCIVLNKVINCGKYLVLGNFFFLTTDILPYWPTASILGWRLVSKSIVLVQKNYTTWHLSKSGFSFFCGQQHAVKGARRKKEIHRKHGGGVFFSWKKNTTRPL